MIDRGRKSKDRILLLFDENHNAHEIARLLGCSHQNVSKCISKYRPGEVVRKVKIRPYKRTQLTVRQKFWMRVDSSGGDNDCWLWKGAMRSEYGGMYNRLTGQAEYSHHLAFLFSRGKRQSQWVLHRCGNPMCCNPSHLYDGTPAQNAADRARHLLEKGTSWGNVGLISRGWTREEIVVIRAAKGVKLLRELADEFNVSRSSICNIQSRRSYGWIE